MYLFVKYNVNETISNYISYIHRKYTISFDPILTRLSLTNSTRQYQSRPNSMDQLIRVTQPPTP